MRPLSTVVARSVCLSVFVSVGHSRQPYKTAKLLEVPFELRTRVQPRVAVRGSPMESDSLRGNSGLLQSIELSDLQERLKSYKEL